MRTSSVKVDGTTGLGVTPILGRASGVVWQRDGMLYSVGGTHPLDRILGVANSLR